MIRIHSTAGNDSYDSILFLINEKKQGWGAWAGRSLYWLLEDKKHKEIVHLLLFFFLVK